MNEDISIDFLDAEEEALFAEFLLGDEAIRFLDSNLGRTLRGFARMRKEEAKEALLCADPDTEDGRRAIRAAQFSAAVADQFLSFVQEAIAAGESAEQNLKLIRE